MLGVGCRVCCWQCSNYDGIDFTQDFVSWLSHIFQSSRAIAQGRNRAGELSAWAKGKRAACVSQAQSLISFEKLAFLARCRNHEIQDLPHLSDLFVCIPTSQIFSVF